jgi:tetratricopeptide (TPR) repeat protein
MKTVSAPPVRRAYAFASRLSHPLLRLAIALCGLPAIARAHGDLHAQIASVSEEIASAPTALLYLKRGGLQHDHENYPEALADYNRAERLDPSLDAIWLARGRTLFKSGQLIQARAAMDLYLKRKPAHADAFLLRARILSGLKHFTAAVRDFDRNLSLTPQPLPECFLERAEALVADGQREAALAGLDEGIRRQGNLVTLQSAAVAIELALGHHDAALARVDRVLAGLPRKEYWLVRRGEILESAGRHDEARRAFDEALASIERLPPHHRDTKSVRDLQQSLRLKPGA